MHLLLNNILIQRVGFIKIHVSILRDHPQEYAYTLLKSLNYLKVFKNFLKIKTLNLKSRWLTPALWQQ